MSYEKFPEKEKIATDLNSQLAWLVREMGYSRDKVKGYEEKLVRLTRQPKDTTSVFGFMSGYWHRFRQASTALVQIPEQVMATRALQANAKVVAGLCDKVAFTLWLHSKANSETKEPEWFLETALATIKERINQLDGAHSDEDLLAFNDQPFEENPMGQAVLALHQSYENDPYDIAALHTSALHGSAMGVHMWQAYTRSLEGQGFSVVMPKPGLSSGNIEAWD